jgi:hypothetical protein
MHRSICVVYERARDARDASRALMRSALGTKTESVRVHYRRMIDGKLAVSQTRPTAGALWGSLSMAVLGAVLAFFGFGMSEPEMMSPWASLLTGAIFGGAFGALAGALIGTTEPAKELADAETMLEGGRAAVVAEFTDPTTADAAKRMLMRMDGVHRAV